MAIVLLAHSMIEDGFIRAMVFILAFCAAGYECPRLTDLVEIWSHLQQAKYAEQMTQADFENAVRIRQLQLMTQSSSN